MTQASSCMAACYDSISLTPSPLRLPELTARIMGNVNCTELYRVHGIMGLNGPCTRRDLGCFISDCPQVIETQSWNALVPCSGRRQGSPYLFLIFRSDHNGLRRDTGDPWDGWRFHPMKGKYQSESRTFEADRDVIPERPKGQASAHLNKLAHSPHTSPQVIK